MRRAILKVLALSVVAAAATSGDAHGQFDLPAPDDDVIVVIGQPISTEQIEDFIGEVSRPSNHGQYARWYDRVCPAVVGLREEINQYVLATIRSVAELADVRLDDDDCRANVVVMFSYDPATAVTDLQELRPDFFGDTPAASVRGLVRPEDTVSVVSRLSVRGAGGQVALDTIAAQYRGDDPDDHRTVEQTVQRAGNNLPGEAVSGGAVYDQAEGSRIAEVSRPEFDFRLILVDLNDVEGQTLRQLSAYTAMVALADVNLDRPIASQQSILNALHDPQTAPDDITDWDLAFIKSLYRTRGGRSAASQRRSFVSATSRYLRDGEFIED